MGSCCSQPEAARRYEVKEMVDGGDGAPRADEPLPADALPAVPTAASPPRTSTRSLAHRILKDEPVVPVPIADEVVEHAAAQLGSAMSCAIEKKENAYRAQIFSEEFSDRNELHRSRRWWGERINDLAAQDTRVLEQCIIHRVESSPEPPGRMNPTDLRTSVMVEEYIIAPAAFHSRTVLAESVGNPNPSSFPPPSVSDSASLRLSPLRHRSGQSSMYASPTNDPIDELLCRTMGDDNTMHATPPPSLAFYATPMEGESTTTSPWRYGSLNPFDEGVRMEMLQFLTMFSASPQRMPFQRSMIREINHDSPHGRGAVVEGDPLLGTTLDEVDGRDVITRYNRHDWHELALLETQERGVRTHMEFGRALLKCRMECWILWVMRFEHHQRLVIEQDAFHAVLRIWAGADRRITMRRAYERQLSESADRAVHKELERSAATSVSSVQRRKVEKLKWEVERSRIKRPVLSARDALVETLRSVQSAAPLAEVKKGASRAQLRVDKEVQCYSAQECRCREAIALEEHHRWEYLVDQVISQCPAIISAPALSGIISTKQQLQLIAAQQELHAIERRLFVADELPRIVEARTDVTLSQREMDRLAAEVALLGLHEDKRRKTLVYQEALFRAVLQDTFDEEYEVHRVHDERRDAQRRAMEEIEEAENHRLRCMERLRRTGRGYLWRRRIGVVRPVADDVRFLVEEHRRFVKHTTMMENIICGDMAHYFALQSKMYFPERAASMVRDLDMYLWSPDCLPHIERHCRDEVAEAWSRDLHTHVYAPFLEQRAVVALIPKVVSERRIASAVKIQRAFRAFCCVKWFQANDKDTLTLRREKRLLLHAERRLLQDRESNERDGIVADWTDTDWAAMRELVFAQSAREWAAATVIGRCFRGWHARAVTIPPLLEVHLKRRLWKTLHAPQRPDICAM